MNNIYRCTPPYAHFLGRQDVETKFWKINNAQRFYFEREMHTVMLKRPGCVILAFADSSSVCVGLFLPLADNF